ncbi:cingulin [Streptococcus panodentis]|uniref:Cingulin n=1 Tax=Streptococcus panodentis TaxID=1581472 RepID=A0ABS5B048_9STRE|nr:cingulin [Streptococcus panodentis]MBP2622195.1 cingulin [Streptococcus panodentis]
MYRKDKSEDKRCELYKKIQKAERTEDDFMELKRKFEKSLEDFYTDFQYLTDKMNTLLQDYPYSPYGNIGSAVEANLSQGQQVQNYVDKQSDRLDKLGRKAINSLEEKREKLIKELNAV